MAGSHQGKSKRDSIFPVKSSPFKTPATGNRLRTWKLPANQQFFGTFKARKSANLRFSAWKPPAPGPRAPMPAAPPAPAQLQPPEPPAAAELGSARNGASWLR